jgi:hypothetical protein
MEFADEAEQRRFLKALLRLRTIPLHDGNEVVPIVVAAA